MSKGSRAEAESQNNVLWVVSILLVIIGSPLVWLAHDSLFVVGYIMTAMGLIGLLAELLPDWTHELWFAISNLFS